jgi:hypothetical protein
MNSDGSTAISGWLHCTVAFDWGENVDLRKAAELVPSEAKILPRRRRTPAAIAYRPSPLRFDLGNTSIPGTSAPAAAELVVFDFGAVNFSVRAPFSLSVPELSQLAATFGEPTWLLPLARTLAEPVYDRLLSAIEEPQWSDTSEEYVIFELEPLPEFFTAGRFDPSRSRWLINLLRLDSADVSEEEERDALRCQMSYGKSDVVLIDWPAAIVIDRDCEDTIQTIEFANLQLLEYRCLDRKVDEALAAARQQIQIATQSRLQFWRTHARPLRILNEIRLDAVGTFERAGSTLQLVGDQYLSRLYRLASDRFHLSQWAEQVRQALDVAESVQQTLLTQSSMYRLELLEITVIALILIDIVLAMFT